MNDRNQPAGKRRAGGFGQRVLALLVFVFLACLIWLAITGQYDDHVNRYAAWLHRQYEALKALF